ncbi:hypothetical protein D3C83_57400 [compost metagenome]
MMLESDDRREGGCFRRPPQHVRAVNDVLLHDLELGLGQLVGLVEDLGRGVHLADVVHQSRVAELPECRAVEIE